MRPIPVLTPHRLTTAEILYHMPDHPGLLQSFIWQHSDRAPEFPRLMTFLEYWKDNIDAALHSVTVSHADLAGPKEFRYADASFSLH